MREIDHIIVHASATKADQNFTSVDIDAWHRARGWLGCGYHYVITRDGTIESEATGNRCRPLKNAGAHVGDCGTGWNGRTIGICMIGGVAKDGKAEDNFTAEQKESLKHLLNTLNRMIKGCTIMGHRDLIALTGAPPKDCPCFEVSKFLIDNGI